MVMRSTAPDGRTTLSSSDPLPPLGDRMACDPPPTGPALRKAWKIATICLKFQVHPGNPGSPAQRVADRIKALIGFEPPKEDGLYPIRGGRYSTKLIEAIGWARRNTAAARAGSRGPSTASGKNSEPVTQPPTAQEKRVIAIMLRIRDGDYYINNNGVNIWAHVAGQGPVCVVITPGWGASVDMYMSSMKRLEASYTMVYMDDRGSGRSDRPTDANEYTMSNYASDIEAVRNFVGADQICLIGHSMGGIIATYYATSYPKHLSKLYLISATPNVAGDLHKQEFKNKLALRQNEPWFSTFVAATQQHPTTDDQFKQQILDMLPSYFHDVPSMNANMGNFQNETFSLVAFNGFNAHQDDFDITALLSKISVPTYLFHGINDPWADAAEGQAMQPLIPNAQLVIFQNSGHFSWMEEPDKFFSYF
jgi:proline iminopeptidase